jgi:hypothetical protein
MSHFELREDFVSDVVARVGGVNWCCPYHRALAVASAIMQLAEEMASPRPCLMCGTQENIEMISFDVLGSDPQSEPIQLLVFTLCSECYASKSKAEIDHRKLGEFSKLQGGSGEVH